MRIGIYTRVSGDEQAKSGYSLPEQLRACTERALAMGATPDEIEVYSDAAVPGDLETELRDELTRLIGDAKDHKIDAVVCRDVDRWSRSRRIKDNVEYELDRVGVPLLYVDERLNAKDPASKLTRNVLADVAEFEHALIRDRTMRGRRGRARAGKLPWGGTAPYGYRFTDDATNLLIVEDEAAVVRRIYAAVLMGTGLNGVAHGLMAGGILTAHGGTVWHRQVVRQIALNPIYAGTYYAGRRDWSGVGHNRHRPKGSPDRARVKIRPESEWIAVSVPAIVSQAEWAQAQLNMQAMADAWRGPSLASAYLLSGLVRCGVCGLTMAGTRVKNWGVHRREYTCRKNTAGARHPGCGQRAPATGVESAVWDRVSLWLSEPGSLARELEEAAPNRELLERELARTGVQIADTRAKIANLLGLVERGAVEPEDVETNLARLRQHLRSLETHQAETRAAAAQQSADGVRAALEEAREVLGNLDELPLEERKALVRQFIERVTIRSDTVVIHARRSLDSDAPVAAAAERPVSHLARVRR